MLINKMLTLLEFTILLYFTNILSLALSLPDTYEIQDGKSHEIFNLMDVLKARTNQNKDPLENWTGRWLPPRPGEWRPPPKIVAKSNQHSENRIPMGVKNAECDDGKTNLTVDWNNSPIDHTCFGQKTVPNPSTEPQIYCKTIPKQYSALHACMKEKIEYDDDIPLYGTHRPIWPIYGEYKFVPKQRWLHNLEHGAIVMLYHPCANSIEVQRLRDLVKGCLRRHIITPYNLLPDDRPLALLTWGCRLTMSTVETMVVQDFIQHYALHAPEQDVFRDGFFNESLIHPAAIVSDEKDSILCPKKPFM